MKQKLFTLFFALVAGVGTMFAESGTCGPNLTWDLTNGVLSISGTGTMTDFNWHGAPWYSYRESITEVSIGNSVTSIGNYAFIECTGLTSVTIPNSVTSIGDGAFAYCSSLSAISLPTGITRLGNPKAVDSGIGVFSNCTQLQNVELNEGLQEIGFDTFKGCKKLTSIKIPSTVTIIGHRAFAYTGLTSVTIPASVKCLGNGNLDLEGTGDGAFGKCEQLQTVVLKEGLETICHATFDGCTNLTSINIPNSVTSIGSHAFKNCTSLPIVDNIRYADTHLIEVIDKTLTSYTIRAGTRSIGGGSSKSGIAGFQNCANMTSISIPNSVTSIGFDAFEGCTSLPVVNNIRYADTYLVEAVDKTLSSYSIKDGTKWIGDGAFSRCKGLTSITIPNSVTRIGGYAFSECSSFTAVTIPNSVTSIGIGAFRSCIALISIDIPNSVTNIGDDVFSDCTGLTSIAIPNSITSIGICAFYGCTGLTSITIPEGVTGIGDRAFYKCSNLTIINVKAPTPPEISSDTFWNKHSDAVVYIPYGSLTAYRTAAYWNEYNMHVINLSHASSLSGATSVTITLGDNDEAKHIVSCGMEGGEEFAGNIIEYIGLEPESQYADVPFFVKTKEGDHDILSCSFSTSALVLTTQESKPISSNTAILLAETNMSEIETSCGFEWKRNDAPEDMTPNKVFCPVANGLMAGRLKGLKEDVYYKYRAFYQSAAGNMFYGDWKYIFTGDVAVEFDPILYTYAAIAVKENEATLKGYALAGSEDFTEQGFEYWAESRANNAPRRTAASIGEHKTVTASGISMKATLTDLDPGTVYRYRSYANIGSKRLYGSEMTLTTQGEYKDPQAIEDIRIDAPQATKILHNGTLYIIRDGKTYTVQGTLVK